MEEKKRFVEEIRLNPESYFRKILKVDDLWIGEQELLAAIPKYKKIAVGSGHALGKDFIGGGLPLWWLSAYYPAKVIMTAPTDRQIEAIMWGELTSHYERAGGENVLGGELQARRFLLDRKDWFCIAFTTKETKGQMGKFQGFHTPNMLIIVSEAQAVDESIFEQLEGIITAENSVIILLGNPLRATGHFAQALRGSEYHSIHLSCLDNPNYKERREVIPGLASYTWVENMRKRYGEDSPIWQGRVIGVIPDESINTIIPYRHALHAINTKLELYHTQRRRGLSIDPATFGDDDCVMIVFEEGQEIYKEIIQKKRTTEISGRGLILTSRFDVDAVVIDTIGEGRGVYDEMWESGITRTEGVQMIEFKGSHEPMDKEHYQNKRAEAWFETQRMLEIQAVGLEEGDEIAVEELADPHYFVNRRGRYQVEEKEDIKERLGRSPNRADAIVQWLYELPRIKKRPKAKRDAYAEDYEDRIKINPMVV